MISRYMELIDFLLFISRFLFSFFVVCEKILDLELPMGKPKLLRRTSSLVQDAADSTKKVLMVKTGSFEGQILG